jgi:dihydroxyacetone kinase-like protein
MIDALSPAADAATKAAADGADVAGVLAAAAAAAAAGAQQTKPMQAHKGRASYLGERSIGHVDPGAQSTAYLLASLAASAADHPEE